MTEPLRVTALNAAAIKAWIESRGGVAVWESIDLSDPGKSWTTPVRDASGQATTKPSWQAASAPARTITSLAEVIVDFPEEVARFRVAVQRGSGFRFELTPGSSRKLRSALAKHGELAWHAFDYAAQEAVIFVPGRSVPLSEWTPSEASDDR